MDLSRCITHKLYTYFNDSYIKTPCLKGFKLEKQPNNTKTYEFVEVPAIIKGKNTGHIGLGIVSLDI